MSNKVFDNKEAQNIHFGHNWRVPLEGSNDFLPLENVFHWFPSNSCYHSNVDALK